MPVTAYKFPAYRLHYSLVISQRYTKATQRATKNNKSLCVTLCMLCGSLCSKSCFAGISGRKYIRGYLKITSGMPNTQNGTRIKRIWRIFTECIGAIITLTRGRNLPGICTNAQLSHYCLTDLPSVRKVLSRRYIHSF